MESQYRCGPGWFPEWMRRILSVRFNLACAAHDSAYAAGVDSREAIDRKFLSNMLELAGWNPFWILMAYLYFAVALAFGRGQYRGAPDDHSD